VKTRLSVLLAGVAAAAAALAGYGGGSGVSQGSQALGHIEINPHRDQPAAAR
jgi:hypothetical protein